MEKKKSKNLGCLNTKPWSALLCPSPASELQMDWVLAHEENNTERILILKQKLQMKEHSLAEPLWVGDSCPSIEPICLKGCVCPSSI